MSAWTNICSGARAMRGRYPHAAITTIINTDLIRASMGSHGRSVQPGPDRAINRTDFTHKLGNAGSKANGHRSKNGKFCLRHETELPVLRKPAPPLLKNEQQRGRAVHRRLQISIRTRLRPFGYPISTIPNRVIDGRSQTTPDSHPCADGLF